MYSNKNAAKANENPKSRFQLIPLTRRPEGLRVEKRPKGKVYYHKHIHKYIHI